MASLTDFVYTCLSQPHGKESFVFNACTYSIVPQTASAVGVLAVSLGASWVGGSGCLLGASWVPLGCLLGAFWVPPGCLVLAYR